MSANDSDVATWETYDPHTITLDGPLRPGWNMGTHKDGRRVRVYLPRQVEEGDEDNGTEDN